MLREALPQAPHEPGAGSVGRMSEPDPHRPPGHRRRTVHDFDSSYSGQPPWDIGRPQPAFVEIGDVGKLEGCVLDVGCGTGEHALMAAERGRPALGVDTPRRRSRSPSGTHGSGGLPRGSWCGTPSTSRAWESSSTRCWTAGCSRCSTTTTGSGTSTACGLRPRAGATTCCASAIGSRAIEGPAGSRETRSSRASTAGGSRRSSRWCSRRIWIRATCSRGGPRRTRGRPAGSSRSQAGAAGRRQNLRPYAYDGGVDLRSGGCDTNTRRHLHTVCAALVGTVRALSRLSGSWRVRKRHDRLPDRFNEVRRRAAPADRRAPTAHTPLESIVRLGSDLDIDLWMKDESHGQTYSHKDRLARVAAAHARQSGAEVVVVSSSGNHGAAIASACTRLGITSVCLTVPEIAAPLRALIEGVGGLLVALPRPELRWALMSKAVADLGWYPASNFSDPPVGSNPYAVDGYKPIAWEIVEQLGASPSWSCAPPAMATFCSGSSRASARSAQPSRRVECPRMLAACTSSSRRTPYKRRRINHPTRAVLAPEALSIGVTTSTHQALAAVRRSDGSAQTVDAHEVIAARHSVQTCRGVPRAVLCRGACSDHLRSPSRGDLCRRTRRLRRHVNWTQGHGRIRGRLPTRPDRTDPRVAPAGASERRSVVSRGFPAPA